MATPLRLRTDRRQDGVLVLVAAGELDLSNINTFSDAIAHAITAGVDGSPLHVDLSEVEYLDSGAINVLFDHVDSIELVVNPVLLPVLKVSGLTEVARIRPATSGD